MNKLCRADVAFIRAGRERALGEPIHIPADSSSVICRTIPGTLYLLNDS